MFRYALITLLLFLPLVQEKKETKVEGLLYCIGCKSRRGGPCKNVIEYYHKKNGYSFTIRYYLDDNGAEEHYHTKNMVPALITGRITEKNGVKYIIPSQVKVAGQEDK